MNLNKRFLIAASLTAVVAANGVAFAAAGTAYDTAATPKHVFVTKGEHNGDFKGGKTKIAFRHDNAALLAFLKIDAATLKSELQAGKTLAAIAGERGISRQQLRDFMTYQMTQKIDQAVAAGKIAADKAYEIKVNIAGRVDAIIDGQGGKFIHKTHRAHFADDGKLLSLLKIDKETLVSEIKAGKTLVAIAGERGVSRQQLKDFMVANMAQRLDERVAAGDITAERADEIKAGMAERVDAMLDGKGPVRIRHERKDS